MVGKKDNVLPIYVNRTYTYKALFKRMKLGFDFRSYANIAT